MSTTSAPDSGGIGRWRGGCGQRIKIEVTRSGSRIMLRGAERFRFTSWGVAGGGPGAPYQLIVDEGRPTERVCPKLDSFHLVPGETLTVAMPGAAGFGDPAERDGDAIRRDVHRGFVSAASADRNYDFASAGTGDPATAAAPRPHRTGGQRPSFDFGAERRAWEKVFDDAAMLRVNALLFGYPRAIRSAVRRQIFDDVVPDLATQRHRQLADLLSNVAAARERLENVLSDAEKALSRFGNAVKTR